MKKIISAISLGVVFIVTFAAGVGCIVKGAGDFSWDKVNEYVSLSDMVKIDDEPISNLFGFSDHTPYVESEVSGKIECPTSTGTIEFKDVAARINVSVSEDEYIHLSFKGSIRNSCVVNSADNLAGTNIPNLVFKYNESSDKATIQFKKLRTNDASEMCISIPAGFGGNIVLKDVAGKIEGVLPIRLTDITADDIAGKLIISDIYSNNLKITNCAGKVNMSNSQFNKLYVSNATGKIDIEGSVERFEITDIMGKVNIISDKGIYNDCKISDIMGSVDISFPEETEFRLERSDIVGKASCTKSYDDAMYTIKVSDVMGVVTIKN